MPPREIRIFKLPFCVQLIAMKCNADKDGKLTTNAVDKDGNKVNEIALFGEAMLSRETGLGKSGSIWQNVLTSPQDIVEQNESEDIKYAIEVAKAAREEAKIAAKKALRQEKITNLVVDGAIEKGKNPDKIDVEYWTNIMDSTSESYNIPPEILVAITAKEGAFDKHVSNKHGMGPMGVTPATTNQILTQDRNWKPIVESLDEDLYKDIMYKKDKDGNFIKDSKGNFVRKYRTVDELNHACSKDDELGMKLGTFAFKLNYAKAAAEKLYGSANHINIKKAIMVMKNNEITFTADENKALVMNALKRYNTVFKTYAKNVIESMINRGINFAELDLIK